MASRTPPLSWSERAVCTAGTVNAVVDASVRFPVRTSLIVGGVGDTDTETLGDDPSTCVPATPAATINSAATAAAQVNEREPTRGASGATGAAPEIGAAGVDRSSAGTGAAAPRRAHISAGPSSQGRDRTA